MSVVFPYVSRLLFCYFAFRIEFDISFFRHKSVYFRGNYDDHDDNCVELFTPIDIYSDCSYISAFFSLIYSE
jgi:hypothetical protein